jgi:hypothetical protein
MHHGGGADYKTHTRLGLYLGKYELSDIYNKFKKMAKLIVFKIPKNYDFTNFIQKTYIKKYNIYGQISKKNVLRYYLLFVRGEKTN